MKLDPQVLLEEVPRERLPLLELYSRLLQERGIRLGLIARGDSDRIEERHVLDSLRAVLCLKPEDRLAADVGSGGGLPGIPVAIARPGIHVVLIEPRAGRAAFLELAVQELDLANAEVRAAEAAGVRLRADACLARALAPPGETWARASPLLRPGGRVLYFGGRSWSAQAEEALRDQGVRCQICASGSFRGHGPIVIMQDVRTPHD